MLILYRNPTDMSHNNLDHSTCLFNVSMSRDLSYFFSLINSRGVKMDRTNEKSEAKGTFLVLCVFI